LNLNTPELKVREPDFAVLRYPNNICPINLHFGGSVRRGLNAIAFLKRSVRYCRDCFGSVSPPESYFPQDHAQPRHAVLLVGGSFRIIRRSLRVPGRNLAGRIGRRLLVRLRRRLELGTGFNAGE
jgi:hypothetical protein